MVLSKVDATPRTNPSLTTNILVKFQDAVNFDQQFHYIGGIGKLNYLEKSNQPYITYEVHRSNRFSKDTIKPHGEAVKRIGCYLKLTDKMGIYIIPQGVGVNV